MLSFDSLPQARVVRTHGKLIAPPPAPRPTSTPLGRFARESAEILFGMWPVTAVMLFAVAMLVLAGNAANY